MGQQAHSFACHPREGGDSHFFSTREGWDNNITSFIVAPTLSLRSRGLRPFHSPLARRVRDGTSTSLCLSMPCSLFSTRRYFAPSSLRERDGTTISLRSLLPSRLRPLAVILDCVWFASLTRSQSNPLRGFSSTFLTLKQKVEPFGSTFRFKEREGFEPSDL